jgi:hypothetical protein
MKFNHPQDTKAFAIGVIASIAGVILWDILKYNFKLLEYSSKSDKFSFFKGFNTSLFKNKPYPSEAESLREVENLKQNQIKEDMVRQLDQVKASFHNLLKKENKPIDTEAENLIDKDLDIIIKDLKNHYDRPRPNKIQNINYVDLASAKTPSYPSGHSTQSRFMALYYADKYPEIADKLIRLGEAIGQSRLNARVHYLSDHNFGKEIAKNLFDNYKNKN